MILLPFVQETSIATPTITITTLIYAIGDKENATFRNPKIVAPDGQLRPAPRAPWILELLGMTAGLSYPDADPAGQAAARVFREDEEKILQGGGMDTVTFCNRLGEQPLAFAPGTGWRYSTCAWLKWYPENASGSF